MSHFFWHVVDDLWHDFDKMKPKRILSRLWIFFQHTHQAFLISVVVPLSISHFFWHVWVYVWRKMSPLETLKGLAWNINHLMKVKCLFQNHKKIGLKIQFLASFSKEGSGIWNKQGESVNNFINILFSICKKTSFQAANFWAWNINHFMKVKC